MHIYSILPTNHAALEVLAPNERKARALARMYLGMHKLPKGTLVHSIREATELDRVVHLIVSDIEYNEFRYSFYNSF